MLESQPEVAMGRLNDRIAVITGAASGIGFACAERFAREGATIAGVDLAAQPGNWAAVVAAAPKSSFTGGVDVRDEAAVQAAIAAIRARHERIDVLVNGAGVEGVGQAHELEVADWDRTVDINLKGSFIVAKHVVPVMMNQQSGSIVNIASVEGLEGMSGALSYNVSKGGVLQLTRTMALDYAALGIRVNCVCPGLIDTPLTQLLHDPALKSVREQMIGWHAMGRAGRPEEVAAAILFLASDDASFVTGHPLVVDGGWMAGKRLQLD